LDYFRGSKLEKATYLIALLSSLSANAQNPPQSVFDTDYIALTSTWNMDNKIASDKTIVLEGVPCITENGPNYSARQFWFNDYRHGKRFRGCWTIKNGKVTLYGNFDPITVDAKNFK
jgi:hypothetical protein